jgi:hypothetical protein
LRHHGQIQTLDLPLGQRQADQATAVLGHEVDRFGRGVFGGEHQVPFVLAVFVVDQDHGFARAHVRQRLLHALHELRLEPFWLEHTRSRLSRHARMIGF